MNKMDREIKITVKPHSLGWSWKLGEIETLRTYRQFRDKLFSGNVVLFEVVQDCNQCCEYNRYFYKLRNDENIYQEIDGTKDLFEFQKDGMVLKHAESLTEILKNYSAAYKQFEVIYTYVSEGT